MEIPKEMRNMLDKMMNMVIENEKQENPDVAAAIEKIEEGIADLKATKQGASLTSVFLMQKVSEERENAMNSLTEASA